MNSTETIQPIAIPASAAPGALRSWLGGLARGFMTHVLPPLLIIGLLVLLWQVLGSRPGASLPAPSKVVQDTWELITQPFYDRGGNDVGIAWQLLASLKRVAYGYSLAVLAGVSLGVLVGQSTWALRGLDPLFQVLRTVPPLAWLPISLAGFRDGHPSAIFVIFITSIWPIIINTAVGVRNIPADYVNVAKVLRLSPAEYFFQILLPATAPYIFTGLRIGIGMSWLAIVASEMLLGGVGVGFFIWDQYNASRISDIIVALAWVGLTGFFLDRLVALLGHVISRGDAAS